MNERLAAKLKEAKNYLEKAQIAMADATFLTEECSYGREIDKLEQQVANCYNDASYFAQRVLE